MLRYAGRITFARHRKDAVRASARLYWPPSRKGVPVPCVLRKASIPCAMQSGQLMISLIAYTTAIDHMDDTLRVYACDGCNGNGSQILPVQAQYRLLA